jgi:hypothetical protein
MSEEKNIGESFTLQARPDDPVGRASSQSCNENQKDMILNDRRENHTSMAC